MSHTINMAVVLTGTTGQGTITLGAAYSANFLTEVDAGAVDQRPYRAHIQEGADFQIIRGTYAAATRQLTIDNVDISKIGGTVGTTKMSLAGNAVVTFIDGADDFRTLSDHRTVTGTTDTLVNDDGRGLITYNSASAVAVSIAQAATSGKFQKGWYCYVKNVAAGDVTVTPTTSTIEGASYFTLKNNQAALLYSTGTNYRVLVFRNDLATATVLTDIEQSLSSAQQTQARANIVAAGSARTTTILTSGSGSYLTPAGVNSIRIRALGGGGGGAGSGTSGGGGGAGGTTTFGSITANGGAGGGPGIYGNAGGTATGGDVNIQGALGFGASSGVNGIPGGNGASSVFGGAGNSAAAAAGNAALANTGGGGGGAGQNTTASAGAGGAAGGYTEKLIVSPSATYSYAVGAGGTAGTAGTGGFVGGPGGSGIIIIEESY